MSDSGGGGGEDGGGLEAAGSAVQNVADVSVLQKHLRKLVPLLLEDGGEAPAALEAALEEKGAVEHMRKFLSDPQVHAVLVERSTLKGESPAAGRPRLRPGVRSDGLPKELAGSGRRSDGMGRAGLAQRLSRSCAGWKGWRGCGRRQAAAVKMAARLVCSFV